MTPLGIRLRELRKERGISLKEMAASLDVSPAYLSALEHGKRGQPTWLMIQKMINFFHLIWDDAEEIQKLAELSHPRVMIDTADLSPQATELANRLAQMIHRLDADDCEFLLNQLTEKVAL